MGRSKTGGRRSTRDRDFGESGDDDDSEDKEVTVADDDAPAPPDPTAPAKVVPIASGPVITLSTFARRYGGSPIMQAFQHVERLEQAHTRKLTRAEWEAAYNEFLNKPR